MNQRAQYIIGGLGLVAFGVAFRFLPHLPNAAPIGAVALFAGRYFPKRWGILVPFIALLLSDLGLGFYEPRMMAVVYASFFGYLLLGRWSVGRSVAAASLAGSTLFFFTTNAAVWLFSGMYALTLTGLLLCYTMALPFFLGTLIGDLAYVSVLLGALALGRAFVRIFRPAGARDSLSISR